MRPAEEMTNGATAGAPLRALGSELGARYRARKREFLGIGLSCLPDEEFTDAVRQAVQTRSRLTISFINPDYVLRGHKTPGLLEKMNRFDIVLPDGWGVVFGGRLLGLPVPDRQGNDDICPKMFTLSAERGFSNFLFGCREGTPEKAAGNLKQTFPGIPIAGTLHGYQDVARGHAADVAEERPVPRHVAHVHRQVQARLVELGRDQAAREHRLGLGPEGQHPAADRIQQRLHPERVADQEQRPARPVEQREREDSVEPGREPDPLVLVEMGQDLGVAVGGQPVAAGQDGLAQLRVVVDLAVVHDDHGAVLVRHRLGPARHVLDRQPAVGEVNRLAAEEPLAVRPPVGDRVGHGPDQLRVPEARRARYPAHGRYRFPPRAGNVLSK